MGCLTAIPEPTIQHLLDPMHHLCQLKKQRADKLNPHAVAFHSVLGNLLPALLKDVNPNVHPVCVIEDLIATFPYRLRNYAYPSALFAVVYHRLIREYSVSRVTHSRNLQFTISQFTISQYYDMRQFTVCNINFSFYLHSCSGICDWIPMSSSNNCPTYESSHATNSNN